MFAHFNEQHLSADRLPIYLSFYMTCLHVYIICGAILTEFAVQICQRKVCPAFHCVRDKIQDNLQWNPDKFIEYDMMHEFRGVFGLSKMLLEFLCHVGFVAETSRLLLFSMVLTFRSIAW